MKFGGDGSVGAAGRAAHAAAFVAVERVGVGPQADLVDHHRRIVRVLMHVRSAKAARRVAATSRRPKPRKPPLIGAGSSRSKAKVFWLVDENGTVAWSYESPHPAEFPGANVIFDALASS